MLAPLAGAEEPEQAPSPPVLAELAARADLVALVQVRDTDYEYARGFPTGGRAFLGMLIPYKLSRQAEDIVEVYEEGLHENECYFDNPTVFEEGRRHLLFARDNPDVAGQYLGLEAGCALDVLVTEDNRYALRFPTNGMVIADDLSALARPMRFRDSYAVVSDDDLSVDERKELLAGGYLEKLEDGTFRFTHGVPLEAVRELLGEENLTMERTLRR
jgi:hypothetical protein